MSQATEREATSFSSWLAAATQLGALEMPRPEEERSKTDSHRETAGPGCPDQVCQQFLEAWRASQERLREGGDQAKEQELRLQALGVLVELKPEGWRQMLRDFLELPVVALCWGWAALAGAEPFDPPITEAEAEDVSKDLALLVLAPASSEQELLITIAEQVICQEQKLPLLRHLLLSWVESSLYSALPFPNCQQLLWRFLADKSPRRVAFEGGELLDAIRKAKGKFPSQANSRSQPKAKATGEFQLDVELTEEGAPVIQLTPWRAGSLQELISIQLWQQWFESRIWLNYRETLEQFGELSEPLLPLPDWRSFGAEEAEEPEAQQFQQQQWQLFAEAREQWLEEEDETSSQDLARFRQTFMAPITTDVVASALRACRLQQLHHQPNESFLLLHSWMALQVARWDGLRPEQLDWAKPNSEEQWRLCQETFSALRGEEAFPLLPAHRQLDWRVNEVLRPLLFAITSELHESGDSLVAKMPEASRLWHPDFAETTLREAVIGCVMQFTRKFHIAPRVSAWIEHQPFNATQFCLFVDDVTLGRKAGDLGPVGGLMETMIVPAAGHRLPAYLAKRLARMKSGCF